MSVRNKIKKAIKYIINGTPIVNITANITVSSPNNVLKGRKIIVTGGGRGLGFYVAQKCIEEGAEVLITGRNEETLLEAKKKLGERCSCLKYDISEVDKVSEFFETVKSKLGGVPDSLVSNAGVSLHEGSFQNVTIDSWDKQIDINLKGSYFLVKGFCEMLLEENGIKGNVILMTSERGLYGDDQPYGLTKSAIVSYTKGLSRRLLTKGIRVNAIAPGVTASEMTGYKSEGNLYREQACGKRVFLPEEIAEVALFLLSDMSNCISGEIIACNQGNHLRMDW